MSCPFISKDLLARMPDEKRAELEQYYNNFVASKETQETPAQQMCPVMQLNQEKVDDEEPLSHSTMLKNNPGGACPFISSNHTDPGLDFFEVGHRIKYKSKYSHFMNQKVFYEYPNDKDKQTALAKRNTSNVKSYIHSNSELFEETSKFSQNINTSVDDQATTTDDDSQNARPPVNLGKRIILTKEQIKQNQKLTRSYPPVLLQTMFHDNPKFDKYRKEEFSNLFFFSDEIKTMGNDAYQKNNFYLALDFYEQALSLYNWLEVKDTSTNEKKKLTIFGKEPVNITDEKVFNMFKTLDLDCEDELLEKENQARQTADYIRTLKPEYPMSYMQIGQSTYYNKDADYKEIRETIEIVANGLKFIQTFVEGYTSQDIKKLEKILELLDTQLKQRIKKDVQMVEKLITKAQKIYELRKNRGQLILQQRTYESKNSANQYKMVQKMHKKYFDVLEYFRESQKPVECIKIIQEFQQFAPTYIEMRYLLEVLNFNNLEKEVLRDLPQEILELIKTNEFIIPIANELRERMASEEFHNAKMMNIDLMTYAMELLDKEEEKERKLKKKQGDWVDEKDNNSVLSWVLGDSKWQLAVNLFMFLLLIGLYLYIRFDMCSYFDGCRKK
eukprot:403331870